MLRRADSSASDSSSRGQTTRPMSFPNMVNSNQSAMSNRIQELDKQLKDVSIGKDRLRPKRPSLTESESSDISTALSINRLVIELKML